LSGPFSCLRNQSPQDIESFPYCPVIQHDKKTKPGPLSPSLKKHMKNNSLFNNFLILMLLVCSALALAGCATAISREGLKRVDDDLDFSRLLRDPQAHMGKTVLFGGTIIETENYPHRTVLAVIQYPLGSGNRPDAGKSSGGRFLASTQEFLDPAIYRPGRQVTVLGYVSGQEARPLQERMYTYPIIELSEIYLWPERAASPPGTGFHFGVGIGIGF
jgi:outer membrane lipoprotein